MGVRTEAMMVDEDLELELSVKSTMRELNYMVLANKILRIDSLINKAYKSIHQHNRRHHQLLYRLNDMSIRVHNIVRLYIN